MIELVEKLANELFVCQDGPAMAYITLPDDRYLEYVSFVRIDVTEKTLEPAVAWLMLQLRDLAVKYPENKGLYWRKRPVVELPANGKKGLARMRLAIDHPDWNPLTANPSRYGVT